MTWRLAKSLITLRDQANAAWPSRSKTDDGTIGDTRHQAEHSEHNPDENGVVRAEDLTNDPAHGFVSRTFAESLLASRDPRILYCISNRQIASSYPVGSTPAWAWRPYSGSNAHDKHMHISVVADPKLYDDTTPWRFGSTAVHPPIDHQKPVNPVPPPAGDIVSQIVALATASPIMHYGWRNRGMAPTGYIKGMAASYGLIYQAYKNGSPAAQAMAVANTGDDNSDALSWYNSNFLAAGMSNDKEGRDTLRHLFVLLTGLGMRESSGRYCEGRDMSADNVTADTAEAGLFQMSWNIREASPLLLSLFTRFDTGDGNGLLPTFQEGVTPKGHDLDNVGTGAGRRFQELCKTKPIFAVECAAVGMRVIRRHWGPLNRKEAEIRPECDVLFHQIQELVDAVPVS